jgi:hypothetical protein
LRKKRDSSNVYLVVKKRVVVACRSKRLKMSPTKKKRSLTIHQDAAPLTTNKRN